jgi:hypothetical protein
VLPGKLAEITPRWLTERLAIRTPGAVVRGIDIVEVIHGTTTKVRARLDLNDNAAAACPAHVCIKSNFEAHAEFSLTIRIYADEGRFYRDIREHLPVPAPACFYADADDVTHQGLMVLEDLKLAGAGFGKNTEPLSAEGAAKVLDDLAELHAFWWASPRLQQFAWLPASMAPRTPDTMVVEMWGADNLTKMNHRPERAAVIPEEINDIDRLSRALKALAAHEMSSKAPRCLIHGDTHLGNSYRNREGRLCWLDWQLVRRGRCMREVNYFLGSALEIETRRKSERYLIEHYLQALAARGVQTPTLEEAWTEYRRWPVWGLLCWMVTEDTNQPQAVNIETIRRYATAMQDLETFAALGVSS